MQAFHGTAARVPDSRARLFRDICWHKRLSVTWSRNSINRVSEICVEHCAARIVPFWVRRDPCGPGLEYFAGLGAMSAFSTTRADEAFEATFTRPVNALLQREIVGSSRACAD